MKSGQWYLTRKEFQSVTRVLFQAEKDMSYGWDGSYGGHDYTVKKEEKEYQKRIANGKAGLEIIRNFLAESKVSLVK